MWYSRCLVQRKERSVLKEITEWQTEDGAVFETKEEAEDYLAYLAKIELIEEVLEVDCDAAIAIEAFIKKYTKGWK